ncbi:hypothetical protein ACFQ08_11860 [Streptosporangium algeriense]|uniref:Uncharacterized protein n=1 Tax=Streptosporangium algeriense TaxID=1682748 RepID=A0ABW3DMX3_9ACTN
MTTWLVTITVPGDADGVLETIHGAARRALSISVLPGRVSVRFHTEADAAAFQAAVAPLLPESWMVHDAVLEPPLVLPPEDERGAFRHAEDEVMDVLLVRGPLDGEVLPRQLVTAADPGAYLVVPGWVSRAAYEPLPDGDRAVWYYRGAVA